MSETRYSEDHEWIRMEGDDVGVCGITDYAQEQLGELVYVELPSEGQEVTQGADCAVIESVKAAGELKSPATGTVVEANEAIVDEPATVNNDPTGAGWFIKVRISNPGELDALMDEDAYQAYLAGLDG